MADGANKERDSQGKRRQARLAAELRSNLGKRKEQVRRRAAALPSQEAPRSTDEPNESQV